ncbi:ABC transporter ATP-binding protein [Oceanithermus desulfurans]|uniref:ABC transporter ATP-binding protein n=2 Tax=Oceanithermus desulfurans TaxID=227924 RepID=A0A511RND5_9DEIN|nr:ABC transporter ATP-binding protein [Oceanithermus desulfurans]MBB6030756.1 ATP-binding cassette subfamily B protein [Oceanithermus desulfurans]GEM90316.1 ABC transporter ATP-binding protein [Oceanithermus desulfurans NBRC 100063]
MRDSVCKVLYALKLVYRSAPGLAMALFAVVLVQALVPGLSVWAVKGLVNAVVASSPDSWIYWGAFWLLVLLIDQVMGPVSAMVQGNLNERLTASLNTRLMSKVNRFEDLLPFEDEAFYDRLNLLREQASYQPTNLIIFLTAALREGLTLIPLLIVTGSLAWWLPLLLLLAVTPHAWVSFKLQRAVWETLSATNPEARRMDYASNLLLDPQYAKEHRLFRSGNFWIEFYLERFNRLHSAMRRQRSKQLVGNMAFVAVSLLGVAVALWGLFQRRLSAGDMAMFLATLGYMQQNLTLLVSDASMLYESLLYFDEVRAFLEEAPRTVAGKGRVLKLAGPPELSFESVGFSYPDGRRALDGIDLHIRPGELVGLVGENGAGKTTLVKLLLRFYEPSEGRITVNGTDLSEIEVVSWRRHIAAVFQDYGKYALELGKNVSIADHERLEDEPGILQALRQAQAEDLLEKLPQGLRTQLTKEFGGTELSGGEWQKVALARGFFRFEAPLVVLDEPTAALDPLAEVRLYEQFAKIAQGRTAIMVSHRLASVRHADRIVVLDQGRVVESGTHQELLERRGVYAEMWEAQSAWYG